MAETVVMVATSYPRFAGDITGTFMEPIARGLAARGHAVHVVLPWHPKLTRPLEGGGVTLHPFRYAPHPSLNVFGYAEGLKADVALRWTAWASAPLGLAAGIAAARRLVREVDATIVHGHWVVPGGAMAAVAAAGRPLVVSLHGSDVFVAERSALAGRAARSVFRRAGWVTGCSQDLSDRAVVLGAPADRTETVPYGVDTSRFAPSAETRAAVRAELAIGDRPFVFAAGRLVRKKGFEHLIDAASRLRRALPGLYVAIAGDGDLGAELAARAGRGPDAAVALLGNRAQHEIARLAAAADVVAVPSVHDEAGNVDGLPNFALEALATATPVVATNVGGLPQAIEDGVNGRLVAERDGAALADAIAGLLQQPSEGRRLGAAARARVEREFGWARVAERFEAAYERARRG